MATTSYIWSGGPSSLIDNQAIPGESVWAPTIAANAAGTQYFAAWKSSAPTSVDQVSFGRLIDGNGAPLTSEFSIHPPSAYIENNVRVAGLADGRFVAAYTDRLNDPEGDIRARLFNADGTPGVSIDVSTHPDGNDAQPNVAALADGGFVVTWTRYYPGFESDLAGAVYNADGSLRVTANNFVLGPQKSSHSSVAGLAGGGFVLAWEESSEVAGDTEVRFRLLNDTNSPQTNPAILIDTIGSINQDIQVKALPDGGFVVAYVDSGWGNGTDITTRIYNADGTARTPFLHVNAPANGGINAGDQVKPSIAVMPNGYFVVSWITENEHDQVVQAYDSLGNKLGQNTPLAYSAFDGEIASLGNRIATVWRDYDGSAIHTTQSSLVRVIMGTDAGETIVGVNDGLRELIKGAGGSDTLEGGPGEDMIAGGDGDDTAVFAHNFNDYTVMDFGAKIMVVGPDGTDTLTGVEHLQFANVTITPVDDGDPLFDTLYYLSRNPDVFQAGVNAHDHFNASGRYEGRDPNPFFDTSGYLAVNKDVAMSGMNPLEHYHQAGWQQGRDPAANFDTTLYLIHNPDVAAGGVDPLAHFLQFGMAEGRQAYEAVGQTIGGFDAQYYLFHNPDVAAAGADPLQHFNTFGWHEGRNPNAYFDTAGYLSHYADVAASGANPLQHYEQFGWHEGRDPSAKFDTLGYLAANPDVAAANVNPLDHFLQNGIYEGRQAVNDGMWH